MAAVALTDLAGVRAQLPAIKAVTYLNTAMGSPLPVVAANAMINDIGAELATGRGDLTGCGQALRRIARLRGQLATVIGASPRDIALTASTNAGIDVVVSGHSWRPGDRIVTTTLEHPAALAPLYRAHQRYGVDLVFADVGNGEAGRTVDAIAAAVDHPATTLLMVSHVTYGTGALLPLDEIVRVAHDAGVEVLADGAQSVGAGPVDVTASGADYLAFPGRKWLFGPDGTGALYVHPAKLGDLHPREPRPAAADAGTRPGEDAFHEYDASRNITSRNADASHNSRFNDAGASHTDASLHEDGFHFQHNASRGNYVASSGADTADTVDTADTADTDPMRLPAGAARFDRHCGFQPLVAGWSASLDWLGAMGWPAVHATIAARTEYALARAAELPGSRVLTPAGSGAGIVAFTVDGVDPDGCVEYLAENAVVVRSIPDYGAIRVSCGFFTNIDEIDRAFSLIDAFRRRS